MAEPVAASRASEANEATKKDRFILKLDFIYLHFGETVILCENPCRHVCDVV